MNDKFVRDCADDEMFRRCCGLMGRDPRQPKGRQSKAGMVAPWNWLDFDDVPPPPVEGRTLEQDNNLRNSLMDKYQGSGYAAAQEIIDGWSLRLSDEPDFEERFRQWCDEKDPKWRSQRVMELRNFADNVEHGGRVNRVVLRPREPTRRA
eukprot:90213-Alexandrium_andersonii.AAC.1